MRQVTGGEIVRIALFPKSFVQSHNGWAMPPLIDFVRSISAAIAVDVYTLYHSLHTHSFRVFGAQKHSFDLGRHTPWLRKFHSGQIKKAAIEHAARPYGLSHAIWADTPAALDGRGRALAHYRAGCWGSCGTELAWHTGD